MDRQKQTDGWEENKVRHRARHRIRRRRRDIGHINYTSKALCAPTAYLNFEIIFISLLTLTQMELFVLTFTPKEL